VISAAKARLSMWAWQQKFFYRRLYRAKNVRVKSDTKMEYFCVTGGPLGRFFSPHSSLGLLLLATAQILLISGQQGKA
jgi:hypothetical protein